MSVDRIRRVTFPLARRGGYSKRAVDRFHDQLADWLETGRGDPARSELLRTELERVARRAARIVTEAELAAQETRADARREAKRIIERARQEAARPEAGAEAGPGPARAPRRRVAQSRPASSGGRARGPSG